MRTRRWWNWLKRLLLIVLTFALVAACQDPSSRHLPVSQNQTNLPDGTASCRVVLHELGKTEICGQPQRVAALSPHILDSILALGVQPVAYAEATVLNLETFDNPKAQIPFLGEYVTTQPVNVGDRKNPSIEKLALIQPDLILSESWLNQGQYQLLNQIAPTALVNDSNGNEQRWFYSIEPIAQALGREQAVKQLVTTYEQQLAATRSQLQPVIATYPKVLILAVNTSLNDVVIAADSTAGLLLEELGFDLVFPESASLGEQRWLPTSVEVLPNLDADIVLVIGWDASELYNPSEKLKNKWNQNPILKTISDAKADRIFFVDYQLWGSVTRGPITDQLILKKLPEMLLPLLSNR